MNTRRLSGAFALISSALTISLLGAAPAFARDIPLVERDVPYVPTPEAVVEKMLDLANVGPGDVVYDLGCGDGRIVIAAAKRGARGLGVDIDPQRIRESIANAETAGVSDKAKFVTQDLFALDLGEATVVTMYLLTSVNMKLRPKLLDLEPGTRIVSHAFDLGDWRPEKTEQVGGSTVYYWTVPEKKQP